MALGTEEVKKKVSFFFKFSNLKESNRLDFLYTLFLAAFPRHRHWLIVISSLTDSISGDEEQKQQQAQAHAQRNLNAVVRERKS
jgi:hypothetical protein